MKYQRFASRMREDLYRKLKLLSAAEGRSIQDLLEEAVDVYLAKRSFIERDESEGEWTIRFSTAKVEKGKD